MLSPSGTSFEYSVHMRCGESASVCPACAEVEVTSVVHVAVEVSEAVWHGETL